jgi:putative ABC transport system substrate-binding protein
LIGKRIQIARELVPTAKLVALVTDPTNPTAHEIEVREARATTKALGLELSITEWNGDRSIEPALSELPRDRKLVLVFGGGPPFRHRGYLLAHLAVSYELAAVHGNRTAVDDGGLASFGPRYADGAYLMGVLAARVLNGEQPSGLPVRRIARTELVINPFPAKSLGLQLPAALLARADEVIE